MIVAAWFFLMGLIILFGFSFVAFIFWTWGKKAYLERKESKPQDVETNSVS